MSGLRFDVVAVVWVTPATDLDTPARVSVPVSDRLTRYRNRNAVYAAARRRSGFGGYSLRPGCDFVIDGQHVAATPR